MATKNDPHTDISASAQEVPGKHCQDTSSANVLDDSTLSLPAKTTSSSSSLPFSPPKVYSTKSSRATRAFLDDECGLLEKAEALYQQQSAKIMCPQCKADGRTICGTINRDSANGRRRYKCKVCKSTFGCSTFLCQFSNRIQKENVAQFKSNTNTHPLLALPSSCEHSNSPSPSPSPSPSLKIYAPSSFPTTTKQKISPSRISPVQNKTNPSIQSSQIDVKQAIKHAKVACGSLKSLTLSQENQKENTNKKPLQIMSGQSSLHTVSSSSQTPQATLALYKSYSYMPYIAYPTTNTKSSTTESPSFHFSSSSSSSSPSSSISSNKPSCASPLPLDQQLPVRPTTKPLYVCQVASTILPSYALEASPLSDSLVSIPLSESLCASEKECITDISDEIARDTCTAPAKALLVEANHLEKNFTVPLSKQNSPFPQSAGVPQRPTNRVRSELYTLSPKRPISATSRCEGEFLHTPVRELNEIFLERGIGPKRQRALRTAVLGLRPPVAPPAEGLRRVVLNCTETNPVRVRSLLALGGIKSCHIYSVMHLKEGMEILISHSEVKTLLAFGATYGLEIKTGLGEYPHSKSAHDGLLKRLHALAKKSQHENVKMFFAEWANELIAMGPPKTVQPAPVPETEDVGFYRDTEAKESVQAVEPGPVFPQPAQTDADKDLMTPMDLETQTVVLEDLIASPETINTSSTYSGAMASWICVSYLNVCGLSNTKLLTLINRLAVNELMFLAETWHINDASRITHPNIIAISIERDRSRVSRGKGGLIAIAHNGVINKLSCSKTTEHSITISYGESSVTGVYLPPSLDPETIENILLECTTSNIILGDLNITWPNVRPSDAARNKAIANAARPLGMSLLKPCKHTGNNHLDHTLAKQGIQTRNYNIEPACIPTDHPLLTLEVLTSKVKERLGTDRFRTYKLNEPSICKSLVNILEVLARKVNLTSTIHSGSTSRHTVKQNIELLDLALTFILQYALNITCGTHTTNGTDIRHCPTQAKDLNIHLAIKMIRASNRETKANKDLVAKNQHLSPEEEAVEHFTAIYKNTSEPSYKPWKTDNKSVPPTLATTKVIEAINLYPNGKSPGSDYIDKTMLSVASASPAYIAALTGLYTSCLTSGYTPKRWNTSVIYPIPKQGKESHYIVNRRPIALTVLFRRIFEKLIHSDLVYSTRLNRGQAGFRKGFSCPTQILLAQQAKHLGANIQVFLDLKAAYDSVPINKLLVKLGHKNIPHYLIELVESLQTNCSTVISVNGNITKPILLEKGLFQGSILSPILFDIFIDDLAETINSPTADTVPCCLLFADDILLTAKSHQQMNNLLRQTAKWCKTNYMAVNITKCGTFHTNTHLHLEGQNIPVVQYYRYLGVPLCPTGPDPVQLLDDNHRKALGAFLGIKDSLTSQTWPPAIKINIYKMYIRSVFEHGAPLVMLLKKQRIHCKAITARIKLLQKLQNECLQWAFEKRCSKMALESMAAIAPVALRFQELTARFRLHLEKCSDGNPIKHWLTSRNASVLLKAAGQYPVPDDKLVDTINTLYREKALIYQAKHSIMARYIWPTCRLENGMDACLMLKSKNTRSLAIAWRCNTFGMHQTCKTCSMPFTRRHVECAALPIHGDLATEYLQWKTNQTFGPNYTILDHLLNRKRFGLFKQAITALKANLQNRSIHIQLE
jgi:hypothetical protein